MLFPSPKWARDNRDEEHWGSALSVARTSGEHSQLEVELGRHSVALYLSKNGMIEPKFEMGFSTLAAFSLQDYYDHLDLHTYIHVHHSCLGKLRQHPK